MKINKKIIEELTRYLKEFNLSEIMYSEGTTQVKVSRSVNNATSMSVPSVYVPEKKLSNLITNETTYLLLIQRLLEIITR